MEDMKKEPGEQAKDDALTRERESGRSDHRVSAVFIMAYAFFVVQSETQHIDDSRYDGVLRRSDTGAY